jgi:hypothetical protein
MKEKRPCKNLKLNYDCSIKLIPMLLIFNPAYGRLANNAETLGYAGIAKSPANIGRKKTG